MRIIDADRLKAELRKLPMMSNWGESMMPVLIDDQPTIEIKGVVERLREEITRRDNLLAEMGIHLPPDEPMFWEYKHVNGAWRRVSSSGSVKCPRCKNEFIRIVGERWYKHCPECGKRLRTKGENV